MKVILEGPDGIGKSTLANYLCEKYNLKIIHSSNKTENTLDYHNKLIESDNIVLDRANLGEVVYPIVFNRKPKMTWEEQLDFINNFDGIYIIFYASDFNDLKTRLFSRGDTEDVLNNAKEINSLYTLLATIIDKKIYKIDISNINNQIKYFDEVILNDFNLR